MATRLHQQLKDLYVPDSGSQEFDLGEYRIDAISADGRLIEVQCASLASIRDKIRKLVERYPVTVVKPLVAQRRIITLDRRDGEVVRSRMSPMRQSLAHVFHELVHFSVFPHPNLHLDVVLTCQEEIRIPPTSRSSWKKKYSVQDRALVEVQRTYRLKTSADLWRALALDLQGEFTTRHLAEAAGIPRWLAQKAAWCLRNMNQLEVCGKLGHSVLYRRPARKRRRVA
jgi:hypothetical protein